MCSVSALSSNHQQNPGIKIQFTSTASREKDFCFLCRGGCNMTVKEFFWTKDSSGVLKSEAKMSNCFSFFFKNRIIFVSSIRISLLVVTIFSNLLCSNYPLNRYLICILICSWKIWLSFESLGKLITTNVFLPKAGDCILLLGKALLYRGLQCSLCRIHCFTFFQDSSVETYLRLQVFHKMM